MNGKDSPFNKNKNKNDEEEEDPINNFFKKTRKVKNAEKEIEDNEVVNIDSNKELTLRKK